MHHTQNPYPKSVHAGPLTVLAHASKARRRQKPIQKPDVELHANLYAEELLQPEQVDKEGRDRELLLD